MRAPFRLLTVALLTAFAALLAPPSWSHRFPAGVSASRAVVATPEADETGASSSTASPLVDMLDLLPADLEGSLGLEPEYLHYVDLDAQLASVGVSVEAEPFENDRDAGLSWQMALRTLSIGNAWSGFDFGSAAPEEWRAVFGFSFVEIGAALGVGPSEDRVVLLTGRFDRATVEAAWTAAGYRWVDERGVRVARHGEDGAIDFADPIATMVFDAGAYDAVMLPNGVIVLASTIAALVSEPLADPTGWFAALQASARRPYPEPLRRAILGLNRSLLRGARSSFLHQIELAIARDDPVSVLHRTAALLASAFDVLFALNRVPHHGEKRLLAIAAAECRLLPPDLPALVGAVAAATAPPWDDGRLVDGLHALVDGLDGLLAADTDEAEGGGRRA